MALEDSQGLRKGPWTRAEDMILVEYVSKYGERNWNSVRRITGLTRNAKSCRLRWTNHLRPDIKKGALSEEEKQLIVQLHAKLGNKWSLMATKLPGRTDNEIKNYWNTKVKRQQLRDGLPTHNKKVEQPNKPLNSSRPSSSSSILSSTYPLNNPDRPISHIGSFNTQANQPIPANMNHHLEHFQYNNNGNPTFSFEATNSPYSLTPLSKEPFLNHGLSDSFPMSSVLQYRAPNFCMNSQNPTMELSSIQSRAGFTPAATSSSYCMTDKDIKAPEESIMNILGDEIMNLLDSSPLTGPIPEWSELLNVN